MFSVSMPSGSLAGLLLSWPLAELVSFGSSTGALQRSIRAFRSDAAFDDQRAANLLEVLVLRREGLEHAVGAGERRVRADVDDDPVVPVGRRERERVFEVGLGARLVDDLEARGALLRNVCLSVRIVSVTSPVGALVSRTR